MFQVTTLFAGPSIVGGGINRLYFDSTGEAVAADAHSATVTFWTALVSQIDSGNTLQLQSTVERLDPTSGEIVEAFSVPVVNLAGSATGAALPRASQGLIRFDTGVFLNSRQVRGRVNIPGAIDNANNSGVPSSAYVAALQNAGDLLINSSVAIFGIWHRPVRDPETGDLVREGSFQVAIGAGVSDQWAVLRSRRD